MKRWGTVTLVLFAFVIGFASTYSCGGGNSSNAADYAPLVHQHDAADITSGELGITLIPSHSHSDYALSSHTHSEYATTTMLSNHTHSEYADSGHQHDGPDILDGSIVNIINQGSAANAGNAGTLDGMDSSDFAESSHSHSTLRSYNIGFKDFRYIDGVSVGVDGDPWISTSGNLNTEFPFPEDMVDGTDVYVTLYIIKYSSSIGGNASFYVYPITTNLGDAWPIKTAPSASEKSTYTDTITFPAASGNWYHTATYIIPSVTVGDIMTLWFGRLDLGGSSNNYSELPSIQMIKFSYESM